jgi:hypothetical protein
MTSFKRYRYCLSLLLLCLMNANSYAQTLKEFFNDKSIQLTYLGVDFSQVKIQGEAAPSSDIREKFDAINSLIITEVKKYDIAKSFKRTGTIQNELAAVNKVNASVNVDKAKTDNVSDLEGNVKPEDVKKHVKGYDLSGKKGIGLVFIMDGMSKTNKEATMYVTLVDLAKKKVLLTERMTGKAQGFGLRNYWAYTVDRVLNSIEKGKYSDWSNTAQTAAEVPDEVETPKKTEAPAPAAKPAAKKKKA